MTNPNNNWIGIIVPTKNGKYMVARAIIDEDDDIQTLDECVISVSHAEGKEQDLKYPFVLIKDLEKIVDKMSLDIQNSLHKHLKMGWQKNSDISLDIQNIINERLGKND
jgi:hypothetical protein